MTLNEIYAAITRERQRQNHLHPGWPWGKQGLLADVERLKVLDDEVTEVHTAATPEDVLTELVQVAAVCVRWLESETT